MVLMQGLWSVGHRLTHHYVASFGDSLTKQTFI